MRVKGTVDLQVRLWCRNVFDLVCMCMWQACVSGRPVPLTCSAFLVFLQLQFYGLQKLFSSIIIEEKELSVTEGSKPNTYKVLTCTSTSRGMAADMIPPCFLDYPADGISKGFRLIIYHTGNRLFHHEAQL